MCLFQDFDKTEDRLYQEACNAPSPRLITLQVLMVYNKLTVLLVFEDVKFNMVNINLPEQTILSDSRFSHFLISPFVSVTFKHDSMK